MSPLLLVLFIILVLVCIIVYFVVAYNSDVSTQVGFSRNQAVSDNLRQMVSIQRQLLREHSTTASGERYNMTVAAAAETGLDKQNLKKSYALTLTDKLKYGSLAVPASQIRMVQAALSFMLFLVVLLLGNALVGPTYILAGLVLVLGPFWVIDYVDYRVKKRSELFERDYASFLMSFFGLLKSGLTTIGALEEAGKAMDDDSILKTEVELVVERIKMGLSDDQAMEQFGEDIYHPEIGPFLQAVLLSKKLGGNLSNTIERLAKQVRRRSQLKQQAQAAVGMEKGSLKVIAIVMFGILVYIGVTSPDLVVPALKDATGWIVAQCALCIIIGGVYWSRSVANIKA